MEVPALMPLRTLAVLVVLPCLSGCDPVYGTFRSATIPSMPKPACVRQVLDSMPGIESVQFRETTEGRYLDMDGMHAGDQVYGFFYQGSSPPLRGNLQFSQDDRGRVSFMQYLMAIRIPPDAALVAASRPVMRQIELSLAQHCDLQALPSAVQERCTKVECPALD